jgi:hypothetical protein
VMFDAAPLGRFLEEPGELHSPDCLVSKGSANASTVSAARSANRTIRDPTLRVRKYRRQSAYDSF